MTFWLAIRKKQFPWRAGLDIREIRSAQSCRTRCGVRLHIMRALDLEWGETLSSPVVFVRNMLRNEAFHPILLFLSA